MPEAALCAMSDIIAESLKNGEKVQIVGFGAFEVKERPARKARNPRLAKKSRSAPAVPDVRRARRSRKPSKAKQKFPEGCFRVFF